MLFCDAFTNDVIVTHLYVIIFKNYNVIVFQNNLENHHYKCQTITFQHKLQVKELKIKIVANALLSLLL